jgi:hypothetical protein
MPIGCSTNSTCRRCRQGVFPTGTGSLGRIPFTGSVTGLRILGHQPQAAGEGQIPHRITTSGGSDENAAELVVEADVAFGPAARSLGATQLNASRSADLLPHEGASLRFPRDRNGEVSASARRRSPARGKNRVHPTRNTAECALVLRRAGAGGARRGREMHAFPPASFFLSAARSQCPSRRVS